METIFITRDNLLNWQSRAVPTVMALGFFDGLHHGHRKVIQTALQKAKEKNLPLSVMSFFPHPKTVLSNGKKQVCYLMPTIRERKDVRATWSGYSFTWFILIRSLHLYHHINLFLNIWSISVSSMQSQVLIFHMVPVE